MGRHNKSVSTDHDPSLLTVIDIETVVPYARRNANRRIENERLKRLFTTGVDAVVDDEMPAF